jgi:hypothetical protein
MKEHGFEKTVISVEFFLVVFPSPSFSFFYVFAAFKGLIRAIKKYQFRLSPLFNNK